MRYYGVLNKSLNFTFKIDYSNGGNCETLEFPRIRTDLIY